MGVRCLLLAAIVALSLTGPAAVHAACTQFANGCLACSGSACTACIPGYRLAGGACQPCAVRHCGRCAANVNVCTLCKYGYVLRDGVCMQRGVLGTTACGTVQNCARCDTAGTRCLDCDDYYGLNGAGDCVACTVPGAYGDRCLDCNGDKPSQCTACAAGFHPNYQGACVLCEPKGCIDCPGVKGECKACDAGLVLYFGKCVVPSCSVPNCAQCNTTGKKCKSCIDGYGLNPFKGTCQHCQDFYCGVCSADYQSCDKCRDGYVFDPSWKCVAPTPSA